MLRMDGFDYLHARTPDEASPNGAGHDDPRSARAKGYR